MCPNPGRVHPNRQPCSGGRAPTSSPPEPPTHASKAQGACNASGLEGRGSRRLAAPLLGALPPAPRMRNARALYRPRRAPWAVRASTPAPRPRSTASIVHAALHCGERREPGQRHRRWAIWGVLRAGARSSARPAPSTRAGFRAFVWPGFSLRSAHPNTPGNPHLHPPGEADMSTRMTEAERARKLANALPATKRFWPLMTWGIRVRKTCRPLGDLIMWISDRAILAEYRLREVYTLSRVAKAEKGRNSL